MVPRSHLAPLGVAFGAPALSRSQLQKARDVGQPGRGVAERKRVIWACAHGKRAKWKDRHPKGTERQRALGREKHKQRKGVKTWRDKETYR